MKVDHQQNHQKYLKKDSLLKINFCYYYPNNIKSQQNIILFFDIFKNLFINTIYLNNKYKQTNQYI